MLLSARLFFVVLFLDGAFFQQEQPVSGIHQADFAPRMTKPVLMVNGRFDATFLYDTGQLPMFRMLGTPEAEPSSTRRTTSCCGVRI